MTQDVLAKETNRRQLQTIISGLSDGVILAEVDQTILWANEAALTMHGVSEVKELGANTEAYAKRFALRYRNNHPLPLDSYPSAAWLPAKSSAMWWWKSHPPTTNTAVGYIACAAWC